MLKIVKFFIIDQFVPFIDLLKQKCVSVTLESGKDYRLGGKLSEIQSYITDKDANEKLNNIFKRLISNETDGNLFFQGIIFIYFQLLALKQSIFSVGN